MKNFMPFSLPNLIFLIFFIFVFASSVASADTSELMIAFVEGETVVEDRSLTIPGPEAFNAYSNGVNLGFVKGDVWVLVRSSSLEVGQFLTIQPVHLDIIQVYDEGLELVFEGGDRTQSPRGLIAGGYTIAINETIADKNLYIRLSSRNIIQPHIGIEASEYLFKRSLGVALKSALVVSVSLFYLAWAISASFANLNALTVAFGFRLISFIFTLGVHSGIIRQLFGGDILPPQDVAHNISALGYITVAQIFDYFLLKETSHKKAVQAFALVVLLSAMSKFGIFLIGQVSLSLQINNLTALLTLFLGLCLAPLRNAPTLGYQNFPEKRLSRFVPTFYFLLQALPLAGLYGLTAMGSTKYLQYADLAFLNYAIVPGGFILYILARRQKEQSRLQQKLQERADRLQRERQAEAEKRRDIGNLLNMLTHEIKTPLATLQMAHAVGKVDTDILAKTTKAISQAITQADHVEEIERGKSMVQLALVDMNSSVKTAILNSYGELSFDCNVKTNQVSTDPGLLQIILGNLIGNALKYKRQDTVPYIKITESNSGVSITVVNVIDRALQATDRLTEKYYRDPANQGAGGTGLGLYIVQLLCDQLGHELRIEASSTQFSATVSLKS